MEELNFVKELAGYGALGIISLYLMYKDYAGSKRKDEAFSKVVTDNSQAMKEFTVILHEIKGRLCQ